MFLSYLKKTILGYSLPQEYACVALEGITDPLRVTLTLKGGNFALDVSHSHLFLGYKPLIIGIPVHYNLSSGFASAQPENICLSFHENEFTSNSRWNGFPSYDKSIARIILKNNQKIACGDHSLYLYEGVYARHEFINRFNQFVNRQKEKRRADRKVNINLSENLADQVQTAYSIPRVISIITLSDHHKMNMFPTDLHGQINDGFYVGSLRLGGKANDQVEAFKNVTLSRVDLAWCKQAYTLGKNHMQDLKEFDSFLINNRRSGRFHFPLPESVLSYHELKRIDAVDIGIHRIHSYEILNKEKFVDSNTLSHIHRFYAQWRANNGKPTKFHWR